MRVVVVGMLAVALAAPAVSAARAPAAAEASRVCVSAGRLIRHREDVSCDRAKRVARRYWSTFAAPSGWTCAHGRHGVWRGYCESSGGSYFDWRPA